MENRFIRHPFYPFIWIRRFNSVVVRPIKKAYMVGYFFERNIRSPPTHFIKRLGRNMVIEGKNIIMISETMRGT